MQSLSGLNNDIGPSEYDTIEFYILGSEDILRQSYIHVTRKNLFRDGRPEVDGPYDLHMGTMDKFIKCLTCGNEKEFCPGHDGHVSLNYPVQSPLFREEITKHLRIFCHACGKIITNKRANVSVSRKNLLVEYGKLARSSSDKNPKCCCCGAVQPHIEKDRIKPMLIWKTWYNANIETRRDQISNTEIAQIFDRISESDLRIVGKTMRSHPRKIILNNFKVPANPIRPDTKRGGDTAKATASDTTTLIKVMIEINNNLTKTISDTSTAESGSGSEPELINMDIFFNELIRGTSATGTLKAITNTNKPADSISNRIPKKPGVIRRNLLGKRLWYMARAVITGNKNIRVDEVGVPLPIAKNIEITEIVQEYNRDRLLKYFVNRSRYPGCVKIKKSMNRGSRTFKVEHMPENARLEIGDTIYRHLVTGDWVCFNRQPSLLFCSIAAHKVIVMTEGSTLQLNSAVCNLYNADFDGDEMNLIIPTTAAVKSEIEYVSNVYQWFIGYKSGAPRMGAFMDTLIGSSELTQNSVQMDRYHAMDIMAQVPEDLFDTNFPVESTKKMYSGREIISMIIPEEVNYTGTASFYNKEWAKYPNLKYCPDEFNVVINRGNLETGVLDKATVGQQAAGGLFHIIHNQYGPKKVLDVIYGFQQITNRFFYYHGLTVSLQDIIVAPEIHEKINRQVAKILAEANALTDRLYSGKLVAPVGMTLREYYQRQMKEKLEHGDEFIEPLLTSINPHNNGLYKLIMSGSKGKKDNLISIIAAIGQFDINGHRLIDQYSNGRSNIYFQRFDTSPEAGGYITTSYTQGIQQTSYIPAAQEARNGLITIALATAISGEQERKFIKSLESIIVNYGYNSVRNNKIIQTLYGETAYDPRRMEEVQFPTISISDGDFRKYKCELKNIDVKFRNTKIKQWLDDEFERLQADRQEYRDIEFILSRQNPHYLFTNKKYISVNVEKILINISNKYKTIARINKLKPKFDPKYALEKIGALCETLGYRLLNDIQERLGTRIPAHMTMSIKIFTILVRSILCTSQLLKYSIWKEPLDEIIDQIKHNYSASLIQPGTAIGVIAAQSVSEPLTQFVLDTKHRSGAKGKQRNIVDAIKEIVSAKPTAKMKNPIMILQVRSEYQKDQQKIQEIANHVEMMPFSRFIMSEYVFFEEYGKPVHPNFLDERDKILNFEKYNFGIVKPTNLTRWVILFRLDQEEMILKGMKIETIVHKIQDTEKFKGLYLVYSTQNAKDLFIRCYLCNTMFKSKQVDFNKEKVIELLKELRSTTIRGIDGIHTAEVVQMAKSYIDKDGSIKNHQIHVIVTEGTNLSACLENPYLDIYNLHTNSIQEIEEIYGIDAARQKILTELKDISKKAAVDAHYSIIADEMCSIGKVTPLEHTGLAQREPDSILLRTAFHGPIGVLTKSAINNKIEKSTSVSSKLMLGTWPKIGTHYSTIIFDENFVETNQLSAEEVIASLV